MRWFANRLLAFLIPVLLFGIALLIAQWNGNDLLVVFCDAQYQYVEFLLYLRRTILSGESIFYSFNMTLGTEMLPLMAYYCLSPLNLIVCLFPENAVIYAFAMIAIVKIGLTGLTFYIFAKETFGRRLSTPVLLACSTAYALCGFVVMYFWQIMWMDAVMILPISALGIKRLVVGKGILVYVLALAYGILTNYYMGFMLCIFSVMWFVYLQKTSQVVKFWTSAKKFLFASLIAGGMAAIALVPTATYMINSGLVGRGNDMQAPQNSIILESVTQLLTGTVTGLKHYVDGPPQIFMGVPMLIMTILYFVNWQIPRREKWYSAGLIVIMLLSFEFSMMNQLWHMGTVEVWFPHRYAFILSFFMIYFAMRCIENWQGLTLRRIMIVPVIGFALVIWTAICIRYEEETAVRCFEIVVVILMTVGLVAMKIAPKKLVMIGVVGGVIVLQCIDNVMHIAMTEKYLDSRDAVLATVEVEEGTEIGMYRTEMRDLWYNDAIMQQRYSLNGFSSTNSERWLSYLNLLGFTKNDRTKIQYNNGTTAGIEDLLAIKYVEGEENEDVWPMMTVVDARVREVRPTADEQKLVRPFEFYNRMFMAMADGGEVYRLRGTTEVTGENYCVKEGKKAGNRDVVKCDGLYSRIGQEAYIEDAEELARYKELVPGVELGRKGAELAGEVEVDSDGKMLMLSLPYSEGWTAEIDGTPVPAERVLGGLMGFAVPEGEHKVILKFTPPGLTAGILVTAESVLVLVIYGIMVKRSFYGESKRRKRFNSKKSSSTKA